MADRRPLTRLGGTLAVLAVLAGCAPTPNEVSMTPLPEQTPPRPTLTPLPEPTTRPAPTLPSDLPLGPVPDAVAARPDVQAAVAAEAERTGVPVADVGLAGYADVTWPDGSIGCPQPGMLYTQALVPGHQLILRVGGQLASYHAARGSAFVFCATPSPPVPGDADPTR
jgi:hypothetical protein